MKTWKKLLAMVLSLAMLVSIIQLPAFAIVPDEFGITNVSVEKSEAAQEISISYYSKGGINLNAVQGDFDLQDSTGNLKLKSITSTKLSLTGENYGSVTTGRVLWGDNTWVGVQFAANEAIVTATYTLAAGTPAGDYTLNFKKVESESADDLSSFGDGQYTATVTVTEPTVVEAPDYELYYTLDKADDTNTDKYIEYNPGDDVVVSVYLKAKADAVLQAFDLYVTNDSNLTYKTYPTPDGTNYFGTRIGNSNATSQHIQAVGYDPNNNPIGLTLPAGTGVKIAEITFTVSDAVVYDTGYPITIAETSNIAVAGTPASFTPDRQTVGSTTLGVETLKTYTVTYKNGVGETDQADADVSVTGMPDAQIKQHGVALELTGTVLEGAGIPSRPGYTFLGWDTTRNKTGDPTYGVQAAGSNPLSMAADVNDNVTLYAQWSQDSYTVNWYYNGDDATQFHTETDAYHYNDTAVYPTGAPEPVKASTTDKVFTFVGWNSDSAATAAGDLKVTGNMDFYAIFSDAARPYTVTWANTDGNGASSNSTVNYGTVPAYVGTPTKAADATYTYTWTGWSDGTKTYSTTEALPAVTGDVTYTATFSKTYIDYTITYAAGDHAAGDYTVPAPKTDAHNGVAFNLPAAATPAPGYTFVGWSDGTATYAAGASYTPSGTATLTAQYAEKTYTVAYDANTGTGTAPESHTNVSFTADFTAQTNTFTKLGYQFNGWNTKADGSGTPVAAGSSNKISGLNLDSTTLAGTTVTLYAQWVLQADYTITYDLDGGALPDGKTNPASYNVETEAFTLNNPTKTGYTFAGWTGTGLDAATMNVTVAKGSTGDREYKATWTPAEVAYKVEYYQQNLDNDDYTLVETEGFTALTGSEVNATPNTYTGFTYDGTVTGTVAKATVAADGSTTLKLYYTRNTYKVTYQYTGNVPTGVTAPTDDATYKYGATVTVKQAPAEVAGYTFKGWKIGDSAVTTFEIHENTTITGEWSLIPYHINFKNDKGETVQAVEFNAETTSITPPAVPAKSENAAWYEAGVWGTYDLTKLQDQDVTPTYAKKTFTVTFQDENGNALANQGEDNEFDIDDKTIVAPAVPEKPGYSGTWPTLPTGTPADASVKPVYTAIEYTVKFETDGGTPIANITYTIESTATLPAATGKTNYSFVNWKVTTADGNWEADSTYNAETALTGKYGNVTLTAQWTVSLNYSLEEYKYAPAGYKLLIVDAASAGDGNVYKYNGEVMYYTTDANYMITKDGATTTAVFYTLVEDSAFTVDKIAAAAGEQQTITYDGDINGDGKINIADANAIFQMVVNTGAYYSMDQLSIAQRLAADMVKAIDNAEQRGSIEDVNAVVAIINGTN